MLYDGKKSALMFFGDRVLFEEEKTHQIIANYIKETSFKGKLPTSCLQSIAQSGHLLLLSHAHSSISSSPQSWHPLGDPR